MKSYLSSIRLLLFSSISFLLLSVTQIFLNMQYERTVLTIIFGVVFLSYFVFIIILMLDLIKKDTKIMKVRVIHIDNEIIRVIKPNGKKRKIRILQNDIGRYNVDQELELILTKRTGQIMEVNAQSQVS